MKGIGDGILITPGFFIFRKDVGVGEPVGGTDERGFGVEVVGGLLPVIPVQSRQWMGRLLIQNGKRELEGGEGGEGKERKKRGEKR